MPYYTPMHFVHAIFLLFVVIGQIAITVRKFTIQFLLELYSATVVLFSFLIIMKNNSLHKICFYWMHCYPEWNIGDQLGALQSNLTTRYLSVTPALCIGGNICLSLCFISFFCPRNLLKASLSHEKYTILTSEK